MNFLAFDGDLGNGKTLGMTLYAIWLKKLTRCELFSNYGVIGAKEFYSFEHFFDVAQSPSSIILLDEAHQDFDSRNFGAVEQRFFSQLLLYFRKLRTTLFLTVPDIDDLDIRMRKRIQVYCEVSKKPDYFIYDFWNWKKGKFIKTIKIDRSLALQIAPNLFDTYYMVRSLEFPNKKEEFKQFLIKLDFINRQYLLSRRGA